MIIIMCDGPRIKPVPPFFSRCENILLAILPGMYYNTTNRCAPPCCGRRSRSAPIRPCQRGTANISAGMMELVDVADSKSAASDGVPVRLRLPAPPPSPRFLWGLAVFLWKSEAISVASAVASLTSGALLPGNPKPRKPCPAWAGGFSEVPEVIFRIGRRTSLSPGSEECPGWPGRSSPWSCS